MKMFKIIKPNPIKILNLNQNKSYSSTFKPLKIITNQNNYSRIQKELKHSQPKIRKSQQQVKNNIMFKSYKPHNQNNDGMFNENLSQKEYEIIEEIDESDNSSDHNIDLIKDKRFKIGGNFFNQMNNFSYIPQIYFALQKSIKDTVYLSNFTLKDILSTILYSKLYKKDYFNRKTKIIFVIDDFELYETLLSKIKLTNSSFEIYNQNDTVHIKDAVICTSSQYLNYFDSIHSNCIEYPCIFFHYLNDDINNKLISLVEKSKYSYIIINNNSSKYYDNKKMNVYNNYNEYSKENHLKLFNFDLVSNTNIIISLYTIYLYFNYI